MLKEVVKETFCHMRFLSFLRPHVKHPSASNAPSKEYLANSSLTIGKCLSFFAGPQTNILMSGIFLFIRALGNLLFALSNVSSTKTRAFMQDATKSTNSLSFFSTDISTMSPTPIAPSQHIAPRTYAFSFVSIFPKR